MAESEFSAPLGSAPNFTNAGMCVFLGATDAVSLTIHVDGYSNKPCIVMALRYPSDTTTVTNNASPVYIVYNSITQHMNANVDQSTYTCSVVNGDIVLTFANYSGRVRCIYMLFFDTLPDNITMS